MSFATRIDLENKIFARSWITGAQVHAREGGLVSSSMDSKLRVLLNVYNAYFRVENFKKFCLPEENLELYHNYIAQRVSVSGVGKTYSSKDLNFELALSEKV